MSLQLSKDVFTGGMSGPVSLLTILLIRCLFRGGYLHLHPCEVEGNGWPVKTRPVLLLVLVTFSLPLLSAWKKLFKNLPGVK